MAIITYKNNFEVNFLNNLNILRYIEIIFNIQYFITNYWGQLHFSDNREPGFFFFSFFFGLMKINHEISGRPKTLLNIQRRCNYNINFRNLQDLFELLTERNRKVCLIFQASFKFLISFIVDLWQWFETKWNIILLLYRRI